MQHVKPTSKGDPLCPLGFHPQVRWPTRCKRCFRDYKEHGNRNKEQDSQLRKDELTVSTPVLSYVSSRNKDVGFADSTLGNRNWTSSSNLSNLASAKPTEELTRVGSSSWTSSPNLAEAKETPSVTVSFTLPRRKKTEDEDDSRKTQFTVRRRTSTPLQDASSRSSVPSYRKKEMQEEIRTEDLQIKSMPRSKKYDRDERIITESIVNENESQEEIKSLKRELEAMKIRYEKAEREKSDFMLRRLASEPMTTRTSASESIKLQQKVNELKINNDDLKDEKRSLSHRVKELETELDTIKSIGGHKEINLLREKLQKAENLCDELMEANEDLKREIRDMEDEMDEVHDKFREDRADEYSSIKKELEQQTKNCRVLSFKLRKSQRRIEQLEAEKLEIERKCREVAGGQTGLDKSERIKQLEQDLNVANEAAARLQKELEEANTKLKSNEKGDKSSSIAKKKAPKLGSLSKTTSGEKVSRESLTRGDSQEDPVQLLRDLQDSLEREADLREQLRFAEEEAENLRKKSSRVEDDNESLVLQLKKMATKARTRRLSPSHQRLTPEPEKDEGISDEEDPSELRLLLELNEQEASVMRRKVEDLETEKALLKKKVTEMQEKLNTKTSLINRRTMIHAEPGNSNAVHEQKIKGLEEEMSQLRLKLIEKERECERLHAEISLGGKKPKMQKSKSLDGDQQTVDLKRQLQVIETEANVLRTKTQDLENENEKLQAENKKLSLLTSRRSSSVERLDSKGTLHNLEKQLEESLKKIKELESKGTGNTTVPVGEIEKLKTQLKKTETDKKKLGETLKRLKDDALEDILEYYKNRSPKKPSDLSTKLQLKKMVDENESEISEILVILKKCGGLKKDRELDSTKEELERTKRNLDKMIIDAKDLNSKKEKEMDQLNKMVKDLETDKIKLKKELEKNKTAWEKDIEKNKIAWEKEKSKIIDTKAELENNQKDLKQEIEKLKIDLKKDRNAKNETADTKKELDKLNKELVAEKKKNEELKSKLESSTAQNNENSKVSTKMEAQAKKIEELQQKIKELEETGKKSEKLLSSKKDKLAKLEKENEELGSKIMELEKDKNNLLSEKKKLAIKTDEIVKQLEELQKEKAEKSDNGKGKESSSSSNAEQDIKTLKEELKLAKDKISELNDSIAKAEKEQAESQEKIKKKEKQMKKEIEEWERKASDLEMDLQADRKMMERLKSTQEKELKAKDLEITQLKTNSSTGNSKKIQELQSQINRLELALDSEKREYEELTSKYEQLEEEHVIIKATLVKEKEKLQNQLDKTENELIEIEAELKDLRETYTIKHDNYIKEKNKNEDKSNECETLILENSKLQAICEHKQSDLEQLQKETTRLNQQTEFMRKENEELRRQMEDFDKVHKVQRNMTADVSSLEQELKEYKTRLVMEEKAKKSEISKLKHRYDHRMTAISDELLSVQGQVARFKRERDSYKRMLDDAQRSPSTHDQQISMLEDELSESKLEASRLKTELVSERSSWEVKISELNSKMNELEEERILSSGRTKITGVKTRMELAWQKEREEQHRLLQETSTLARDLRQTLFEVERERDRERLESKRRIDLLKKTNEEEQDDIRKKVTEMQCDLLELRDAHAKLRTTNEKLRREKDKLDKEREILRQSIAMKKRMEQEEERQIISVYQLVEELTVLAPDLFPSKPKIPTSMPTPPVRRKGPKSREASPLLDRKEYSRESSVNRDDTKSQEVQEILRRLNEAAIELKKSQMGGKTRSFSSFRASSIESDEETISVKSRSLQRKGSTLRKSISLEQSLAQDQQIWRGDDDKEGSVSSVQSIEDMEKFRHMRRDQSLDSRLSGGSTQSEILPSTEKKKKSGIFSKLKKLTKSRSIDQESELGSTGNLDGGSDLSIAEDKPTKRKDKFSGMFKKSASTSRGNSLERSAKPPKSGETSGGSAAGDSTSRPLTRKPPSTAPVQRKMKPK